MSLFTRIANRIIQRVVPPLPQADWFTQFEADNEVWEPHQLTDPEPSSAGVFVTPAGRADGTLT